MKKNVSALITLYQQLLKLHFSTQKYQIFYCKLGKAADDVNRTIVCSLMFYDIILHLFFMIEIKPSRGMAACNSIIFT